MLERLLDPGRDRQRQRGAALRRVGQSVLERALDPRGPAPVDVGPADDVRGKAGLGIEPVGLALQRHAGFAKRVDRRHQRRRGAAAEVEERPPRYQHGMILRGVMLGHQPGEFAGEVELVADDLFRLQADGPHVDRARQRLAVAIDDIAARRGRAELRSLGPGMDPEGGQPHQAQHDDRNDPGVDQHPEHQALVHDREDSTALSDKSEPLGPGDESGRRRVHQGVP